VLPNKGSVPAPSGLKILIHHVPKGARDRSIVPTVRDGYVDQRRAREVPLKSVPRLLARPRNPIRKLFGVEEPPTRQSCRACSKTKPSGAPTNSPPALSFSLHVEDEVRALDHGDWLGLPILTPVASAIPRFLSIQLSSMTASKTDRASNLNDSKRQ